MENSPSKQWIDMGTWVGRHQAFGIMAKNCTAAQAQCLKQIHDSREYEPLGLTWEQVCKEVAGITPQYANHLIHQYERLGEAYFRLSNIARISPETYGAIAVHIKNDVLLWDGEELAITPENADKIRAAIQSLRAQLRAGRSAEPAPAPFVPAAVSELDKRLNALVAEYSQIAHSSMPTVARETLVNLVRHGIRRLSHLEKLLAKSAPELIK